MQTIRLSLVLLVVLAATSSPSVAQDSEGASPSEIVEQFIAAYNDHDIDAMVSLVSPDVTWLFVAGDSVLVETSGTEELTTSLRSYFEAIPSSHSSVESMMEAGRFVSVWERAHWERDGKPASQSSLAVYETDANLITRIWYYPAMK